MHLIDKGAGVLGTVPMVASTIPIAVGAALAFSLRGTDQVSVAFFGDGATEEGLFHESLNFASLRRLPVLFVCENNLYASHLGLKARRRNDTIQEFAFPYRMATERIDGNDAVAVYVAALNAVIRARRGEGPTLLECRTYRWRGHVGPKWDLDVGIRDRAELEFWISKCPIGNLERLFDVTGKLSSEERVSIWQAIHDEVSESVEFARLSPDPTEGELEEHVFLGEGS